MKLKDNTTVSETCERIKLRNIKMQIAFYGVFP